MIKYLLPLLGAFLLTSCGESTVDPDDPRIQPQKSCVWSYNVNTETIGIYFGTVYDFIPKVQYIEEVGFESAQDSIDLLGYCDGDELGPQ